MRLTLRTLLAYLDDTLEPAQAKLIGQKVAESDTAQELIARIKQVTRRRRLTVPPTTGPGGKLDPNTAAEYLDNTLSPDQLAEVEQICLASDVHLAEIAACHQILTLVLGEPALIPPSSRQRMYGLVKGPEAIPFRKPPGSDEDEEDEEPDQGPETDETLRLGLPAYRQRGSWSSRLPVIGGGVAAALLLALAIWQALRLPGGPNSESTEPESHTQVAATTRKETGRVVVKTTVVEDSSSKEEKQSPLPEQGKKGGTGDQDKKPGPDDTKPKQVETGKHNPPPAEVPVTPVSTLQREVGTYLPQAEKEPSLLVERQPTGPWRILDGKNPKVYTAKPLVSLPGFQSVVQLASGLRLTLWGNLHEQMFWPTIHESVVQLNYNEALDLDFTLKRGRVILTNPLKKPLRARLRFSNPAGRPNPNETWDITLDEPGTEVLVDLWGYYERSEKFYKDPDDADRVGPTAALHLIVLKGAIGLHRDDQTVRMEAPTGTRPVPAVLPWNSLKGAGERVSLPVLPDWTTHKPALPPGIDPRLRERMLAARDSLETNLVGRGEKIDVALASALKSPDPGVRILVVRCFGALDDLADLKDALSDEDHPEVRLAAVDALRQWIAGARDHDYKLFNELLGSRKYTKVESENIMTLLHNFSATAAAQPDTYATLIDYLDNPQIAIRELAAWHLYKLAPMGDQIPYLSSAPAEQRQQAQNAWRKLLAAGKLPPRPMTQP